MVWRDHPGSLRQQIICVMITAQRRYSLLRIGRDPLPWGIMMALIYLRQNATLYARLPKLPPHRHVQLLRCRVFMMLSSFHVSSHLPSCLCGQLSQAATDSMMYALGLLLQNC